MAHHKTHSNPVPPGNQPKGGRSQEATISEKPTAESGADFHEQDTKRRLGNYDGAGEHAIQQPGGKNDANH